MPQKLLTKAILPVLLFLCLACQHNDRHYMIGVSQCSQDIWRDKQNAELQMGAYFHDNVDLKFAAAYDSDERAADVIWALEDDSIKAIVCSRGGSNAQE